MSARPNHNSISTERVNQVFDGDANFNFTSCIVNVEGNIANHITYQSNVIIVSDPSSRGDQISRNTGMPSNTRGVDGQAVPPPRGVPVQSHGPSPAASSLEDRWDHEITYDGDTTGKRKAKVETITAVYSRTLDDRERVYVQPSDRPLNGLGPPTVLEFKPQNGNWVMANPIPLPDAAAPVTPLAAVCIADGIEIHLFYVTSHNTIKEMAWNNEEG
ncbi:hypothetical protein QBC37DRAFT_50349 [Rhypophila decipiens]|uniref:Uncharacterized protein n=1 Tax=Rhypophila decipiens TaxID=261697 RepID=A0AAN6Y1L0_9PEZI|nr:hypothetical protein QBC37DRAFT_50349 [Rhypophila decipiens]